MKKKVFCILQIFIAYEFKFNFSPRMKRRVFLDLA